MSEIPSLISTHRPSPSSTSPAISFTLKCLSNFDSKSYITSILTVTALLSLYCVPSDPFLQLKHPSSLHAHPFLRHTSLPSPRTIFLFSPPPLPTPLSSHRISPPSLSPFISPQGFPSPFPLAYQFNPPLPLLHLRDPLSSNPPASPLLSIHPQLSHFSSPPLFRSVSNRSSIIDGGL